MKHEQSLERNNMKAARRTDIEKRLFQQGWIKEDMDFTMRYEWGKQWVALVEQPQPLTERVWTNLYPKLCPLLESNRQERLKKERITRQEARKSCLNWFLSDIKRNTPPLLEVKFRPDLDRYSSDYSFNDIFPDVEDVLEWHLFRSMDDNDLDIATFRQRLQKKKDEILDLLVQWKEMIRGRMVDLLRTESRAYDQILQPPDSTTSNPFTELSDDFKLLLRADSLFYLTGPYDGVKVPFTYREAVEAGRSLYCHDRDGLWCGGIRDPLDVDRFRRYSKAQKIARVLLQSIGQPNASFLELNHGQQRYICARCHDTKPRSWGEIIQHYMEQKQAYLRIQDSASKLVKKGITYNDVHDPEFDKDQPMIKVLELRITDENVVPIRKCNLCTKKPIALGIITSEKKIQRHLAEVHEIDKPELGVHYDVSGRLTFGLEPGFGYDFRDVDDNEPDWEIASGDESDDEFGDGSDDVSGDEEGWIVTTTRGASSE
ncbi:hypothetical protein RSOL_321130 [Rhizoctonia solani AG-3 Rhs1AP]|nr:hypothetical protein RSOL_321130 [Rhizoctonia solani AG-3 Rhs1AP]